MRRQTFFQILTGILLLLWMVMIFAFSAQEGGSSSALSGGLTERVLRAVWPGFSQWDISQQQAVIASLQTLVRKTAHFLVYAGLGVLSMTFFSRFQLRPVIRFGSAWVLCVAYAVSDEWHQWYVPGRSAEVRDVLLDSLGALCGVLTVLLGTWLWQRHKKKRISPL